MGTTPTYGLPFLEPEDPPDIPLDGEQSMLAVETQLERIDSQPIVEVFTSSGTWDKPENLKYVRVRLVGGGGAGGGATATGAGLASAGPGGNAGTYSESIIPAADLASTVAVTIGAGGTGVSGAPGNAGGNTSFGTHVTANGGSGGSIISAAEPPTFTSHHSPTSVTGSVGDILVPGNNGSPGIMIGFAASNDVIGGGGASTVFGAGGSGNRGGDGNPAVGYGAGGGAAGNQQNQVARIGGDGAPGVVIVESYFA